MMSTSQRAEYWALGASDQSRLRLLLVFVELSQRVED